MAFCLYGRRQKERQEPGRSGLGTTRGIEGRQGAGGKTVRGGAQGERTQGGAGAVVKKRGINIEKH